MAKTIPLCFSVLQPEPNRLVLEILGAEETWRLPIDPETAKLLGTQLIQLSESVLESRKSIKLRQFLSSHLVEVPSGTFWMGAEPSSNIPEEECPIHPVTITRPFVLGRSTVPQGLYRVVMGDNPSRFTNDKNPVEMVSWFDAVNFCNRLSAIESIRPAYNIQDNKVSWDPTSNGYRLPTEAEWEYAAKAGQREVKQSVDDLKQLSWFDKNSHGGTHPIGQLEPNDWGLLDMQGNVFEWVWDYWGSYSEEAKVSPQGPDFGTDRICRGGAWNRSEWFCRVTHRYADSPLSRYNNIGFRIARNLSRDLG